MKKLFAARSHGLPADLVLLLLRAVAGVGMALHGWPKIQDPMGWMGEGAFAPPIMLALAAVAEFAGGIALVVGALTRVAALGIAGTMGVAVWFHAVKLGDPFVAKEGGSWELAALYLAICLLFVAMGPGRVSFDRALSTRGE